MGGTAGETDRQRGVSRPQCLGSRPRSPLLVELTFCLRVSVFPGVRHQPQATLGTGFHHSEIWVVGPDVSILQKGPQLERKLRNRDPMIPEELGREEKGVSPGAIVQFHWGGGLVGKKGTPWSKFSWSLGIQLMTFLATKLESHFKCCFPSVLLPRDTG